MWVIQAVERPYKLADSVKIDVKRLKLDGVGPVDNRPSTD